LVIVAFLGVGLIGWPLWAGIMVWLVVVNMVTLRLFHVDKDIAVENRDLPKSDQGMRVPENVLLGMVALGGVLGGWRGMYGSEEGHKTGKDTRDFRAWFVLIVLVQLALLAVILFGVEFP